MKIAVPGNVLKKMTGIYVLLSLVLVFAPGFQPAKGQEVIQRIEAMVNDEIISAYDVGQRMGLILLATGQQIESEEELQELKDQVLENLIDEKLQVQEAEEFEVPVPEEEIMQTYQRVALNYNQTPEGFADLLEEFGSSQRTILTQIRAEFMWQSLVNGRYGSQVTVTDQEVQEILAEMEANAGKQEYRLSEIFLIVDDPRMDARVRSTAQRIRNQIQGFVQFPAFARQFSQSTSAAQGGDLGWMAADQLAPEIRQRVENMDVLEISQPIKTAGGYYIVALTDRRKILSTDPLDETLDMRQIGWFFDENTTEESAREWFEMAQEKVENFESCEQLGPFIESLGEDVRFRDIGEVPLKQLNPELRKVLRPIPANSVTQPINTPQGFIIFAICGRNMPEATLPTPDEIESQLEEQRIAMMARRYLRDLRRDAIIDYNN